jgi:SAM-dependent methyltransferase
VTEGRYTADFFAAQQACSLSSARKVVPIILELVQPKSVVDVGCGTGAWLSVFSEHGVSDFIGVDGSYVDHSILLIPPDCFLAQDLTTQVELDRRFDLAVSLEVAEHLPESSAHSLVASLTELAPTVLFSAAIPGQGGINHINEQWPSYWARCFRDRGFVPVDALRSRVWAADDVAWWYAQNMLLFIDVNAAHTDLPLTAEQYNSVVMDLIHPRFYEAVLASQELTTRKLLQLLPHAMWRSVAWRLSKMRPG